MLGKLYFSSFAFNRKTFAVLWETFVHSYNFCDPLVNCYVCSRTCWDWSEIFCSLRNFVCSQNLFFISHINFVFICKTKAFSHKTFVFFCETSAFITLQFTPKSCDGNKILFKSNWTFYFSSFAIKHSFFGENWRRCERMQKHWNVFFQSPVHLGSIYEITKHLFIFCSIY